MTEAGIRNAEGGLRTEDRGQKREDRRQCKKEISFVPKADGFRHFHRESDEKIS
jgi:hypothetical protein